VASTRRIPGRYRAFVYALLVHAAVIAVVVVGFRWTSDTAAPVGKPVQAIAVEDPNKRKLEEEENRKRADDKRRADEERRLQEQQRREKEEEARRAQQQKDEAEKKRQAEAKRKQDEEAEKKKQAEAKRKQEEARAAEEKKRQEAESRKAAEEAVRQQIAAEEQARVEAARAARAATEAEKYKILIKQKVSRNWSRPAGAKTGLKCVVRVRLAPGGDVLQANVVRSSGDGVFDRSVENAVYKAAPLPLPAETDLFEYFRDIEFLFNPEG